MEAPLFRAAQKNDLPRIVEIYNSTVAYRLENGCSAIKILKYLVTVLGIFIPDVIFVRFSNQID